MEVSLQQAFLQTLVPHREPRLQAEQFLSRAAEEANYGVTVLGIISNAGVDEQVRQAAAVNFKNHIRIKWSPCDDSLAPIQDAEKEQIKGLLVRLMVSSPVKIRNQLSEALTIISSYDFHAKWQSLLPELVLTLKSAADYSTINGIMQTVNSIFKNYRHRYRSNELFEEIKYCLKEFAPTLLEVFLRTGYVIRNTQDPMMLKPLFECQRLCCRIFYTLNFHDIPEFFEDHMKEWMDEFHYYLTTSFPLQEADPEKTSISDEVKAAICENINLYVEKYEEEFQGYLKVFAEDVWRLLTESISLNPGHDGLAMAAMKFMTTVGKGVHHDLFKNFLMQICGGIVVPNVMIRGEDEELFEMNPLEYIRKDVEGSDQDTRRRMACELVKGLLAHFRTEMSSLIAGHIQAMLAKYVANPVENWKDKDCAIYLVVSLAQKQAAIGAAGTDLVNLEGFFTAHIFPELQAPDVNSQPLLKADALKFITMFRIAISKSMAMGLLPMISRFLTAESSVVHSYAAGCLEKLLIVRDGRQPRFTSADLVPFQDDLLRNLFAALKMPESQENQYVMKCIMRVLTLVDAGPMSLPCMEGLVSILRSVSANPTNPIFNHYLFESVAALLDKARQQQRDQELIMAFEPLLFPVVEVILAQNVVEFQQYVFQLLAMMVESRSAPIPQAYLQIFPILLHPDLWQRSANVPAMVRLLQAFLLKAPLQIAQGEQLRQVVAVFHGLVSRKSTEDYAFYIVNTMVESLDAAVLMPLVPSIWNSIFGRMSTSEQMRMPKFLKLLVIFMSLFVVKHGEGAVVGSINSVHPEQPTLFTTILQQFWIPRVCDISGALETKLCAVASTKLMCECRVLLESDELWGQLLDSTVKLLVKPEEEKEREVQDVPDAEAISSYSGAYAQLHNAGRKEQDPLKEVKDPKELMCSSIGKLSLQQPGRFPLIIQTFVQPEYRDALVSLCDKYQVRIV